MLREFGPHIDEESGRLYLSLSQTGVLLLSNMFETFRTTCLVHNALNLAHVYTFLRLTWQACLKKTGVNLEQLANPDMLLMFERGT